MRRGGARWFALAVALLGSDAVAAPHADAPLASVTSFVVGRTLADEELGYFGPEVARAVSAALETAGVEVGAGAEWNVSGRIEAVDGTHGERVRLVAAARGRTVAVEGTLEAVDQLAGLLAAKLVPILVEGDARAGKPVGVKVAAPAAVRPNLPRETLQASAKEPPEKIPQKAPEKTPEKAAEPTTTTPPKKPAAPIVVVVAPTPPASVVETPPRPPDPRPVEPVAPAYPPSSYHPWGGFVAGRVVAHSIPDPPSAYVGTGVSATQALYGFLGRRLRLAVVPTGVGVSSPLVAADEGWRSASRSVVMVRIENLDYLPGAAGLSVRLRMQVVVVREGRVVFRRGVESPASDPARRTDPIYQSVTAALESIVTELAAAINAT